MHSDPITLALSKGRIYTEAVRLLDGLGLAPHDSPARKLILETASAAVRLLIIRAADVPTYVAHGAADLGITGRDVLMEHGGQPLYEPLDLGIARCRMVLAGLAGRPVPAGRLRVATKYVHTTRDWFARQGRQVEIIKLYGSMELAPSLGLADQIVDLVDTGRTLRENGLEVLQTIADISARLIVNKAALRLKRERIQSLILRLGQSLPAAAPDTA